MLHTCRLKMESLEGSERRPAYSQSSQGESLRRPRIPCHPFSRGDVRTVNHGIEIVRSSTVRRSIVNVRYLMLHAFDTMITLLQ